MSTTTWAADPIPLEVTPSLHSPPPQLLQMMTIHMTAAPTTEMGVSSVTSVLSCVQKLHMKYLPRTHSKVWHSPCPSAPLQLSSVGAAGVLADDVKEDQVLRG